MPWLKVGDRFATHPFWARLRGSRGADERTVNEVAGFLTRCASSASGHMTDYYIDLETAEMYGKARTDLLLAQAVKAGLLRVEGRGHGRRWRILEDEDLWQMRARDDVMWERQRNRDRKNPDLTMPVLLRDGDVCRYCSNVVNWRDNKSGRGGTFDHSQPGQPATVETYFVACRSCNSKRLDNPDADVDVPRRPAPALPYFSPASGTLDKLTKHYGRPIAHATASGSTITETHTSPDTAATTARPGRADGTRARPASTTDTAATTARPASTTDTAATARDTAHGATPGTAGDTAHSATPGPPSWVPDRDQYRGDRGLASQDGSGRDRPGTGGDVSGAPASGDTSAPRRGRRARRGNR